MADYKSIKGTRIKNYDTDPDNPITGQVWYNESTNRFKFQYPSLTTTGSWRTGNALNTARKRLSGVGI